MRIAGDAAVVRPYARRIRVAPQAGVRSLRVEAPLSTHGELGSRGWSLGDGVVRPFGASVAVTAGAPSTSACAATRTSIRAAGRPAGLAPVAALRRVATEVRDRALPLRPARALTPLTPGSIIRPDGSNAPSAPSRRPH